MRTLLATLAICSLLVWPSLPRVWTGMISLLVAQRIRSLTGLKAPIKCHPNSRRVPDTYSVTLTGELERHLTAVGLHEVLSSTQYYDPILGTMAGYSFKTTDTKLLDAVRAYAQVLQMTCVSYWHGLLGVPSVYAATIDDYKGSRSQVLSYQVSSTSIVHEDCHNLFSFGEVFLPSLDW